uniref:Uncharacterized protein n=1 Tax=Rhizophora mucronata TaxID=61149 RepID=A0A2P2JAW6_RHIMU
MLQRHLSIPHSLSIKASFSPRCSQIRAKEGHNHHKLCNIYAKQGNR